MHQTDAAVQSQKVSAARLWYESNCKPAPAGSDIRVAAMGNGATDGIDLSRILAPLWDNALAFEQDGEQVLELPAINKAGLMLIQGPKKQKYDLKHPESISKLLIIKSKTGDFRAYVMTITVDAGSTPDSTKLSLNTFKHKEADFSGMMLFHTLQGKLVSGYKYINGAATGVVSAAQPPATSTQTTNSIKENTLAPQPCQYAATNWITAYCTDWFTNGEYDGSNCTISYDLVGYVLICPDNGPMVQLPIPGGGGGATITPTDIAEAIPEADPKPKIDPASYIKCFTDGKTASSYKLTIYVDQPIPGHNDQWSTDVNVAGGGIKFITPGGQTLNVGHTFVGFEKNNTDGTSVKQVMGFYPGGLGISSKAIIKDDSGHPYNVSYALNVNAGQFNAALARLSQDNATSNYTLSNMIGTERNCTDAAISWMTVAGATLPSQSRGSFSNTPGDFGQVLKNLSGATTTTGAAPQSHGPCN